MSNALGAPIPYVAPWRADFERFSSDIILFPRTSSFALFQQVPEGQWWRLVFISLDYATGAVAGMRTLSFQVTDTLGFNVLNIGAPAPQPASTTVNYTWAPGVATYSNAGSPLQTWEAATLPDVIWPPRTKLRIDVNNNQVGDDFFTTRRIAFELYQPLSVQPAGVASAPLLLAGGTVEELAPPVTVEPVPVPPLDEPTPPAPRLAPPALRPPPYFGPPGPLELPPLPPGSFPVELPVLSPAAPQPVPPGASGRPVTLPVRGAAPAPPGQGSRRPGGSGGFPVGDERSGG